MALGTNNFYDSTGTRAADPSLATNLSYNGYRFDRWDVKLSVQLVRDEADRCDKWHEFRIECRTFVSKPRDSGTDLSVLGNWQGAVSAQEIEVKRVSQLLQATGGRLILQYGGLWAIDTLAVVDYDIDSGPKPDTLELRNIGGVTCELVWRCTYRRACCETSFLSAVRLRQFNLSVGYTIKDNGLQTRRVSGFLEIAKPRAVNPTVALIREKLQLPVPLKFRRVAQDWSESPDWARLEWNIVDEQETSNFALPVGIVKMKARQTVRNNGQMNFTVWGSTFTATFETAPEASKAAAYNAWVNFIGPRLEAAKFARMPARPGGQQQQQQPQNGGMDRLLPTFFQIDEDVTGLTTTFTASYRLLTSITSILKASGLWTPLRQGGGGDGDTTWDAWQSFMVGRCWTPYGKAGLKTPESMSATCITVCTTSEPPAFSVIQNSPETPHTFIDTPIPAAVRPRQRTPQESNEDLSRLTSSTPPRDPVPYGAQRFLRFNSTVTTVADPGVVRSRVMQEPQTSSGSTDYNSDTSKDAGPPPKYSVNGFDPETSYIPMPERGGTPHVISHGGKNPTIEIWLVGDALSVEGPATPPRLTSVGGVTPIEGKSIVSTWIAGDADGVPLYATTWQIPFYVPEVPSGELVAPLDHVAQMGGSDTDFAAGKDPTRGQVRPDA